MIQSMYYYNLMTTSPLARSQHRILSLFQKSGKRNTNTNQPNKQGRMRPEGQIRDSSGSTPLTDRYMRCKVLSLAFTVKWTHLSIAYSLYANGGSCLFSIYKHKRLLYHDELESDDTLNHNMIIQVFIKEPR